MGKYLISLVLLSVATLNAQTTASLTGSVSDSSGALLPGAAVTLNTEQAGLYRETTTDRGGGFAFEQVAPGTYSLEVREQGFKTYVARNIVLLVNTPSTVQEVLAVGQISEYVSV